MVFYSYFIKGLGERYEILKQVQDDVIE